ncbi:MAG: ATP-dependent nuclease [Adlercreutzia equolifaciens]
MESDRDLLYIGKLVLHNFKVFSGQDFIFDLGPGINYIIGDNNCGKTSLLQALQFALTGAAEDAAVESMRSTALLSPGSKSTYVECSVYGSNTAFTELASSNDAAPLMPYIAKQHDDEEGSSRLAFRRYLYLSKEDSSDLEEKTAKTLQAANGNTSKASGIQSKTLVWDQASNCFVELKKPKNLSFLFQTAYFGALAQPADVISGNSSSIAMKLMTSILENNGFEEGAAWEAYKKAGESVKSDPESGLTHSLKKIGEEVSALIHQRFPDTIVRFSSDYEPTLSEVLKKLTVIIEENGVEGDLSSKGSGLQRDVAFALSKIQAQSSRKEGVPYPQLLLVFDEPENCLHPRAQVSFPKDYRSSSRQCFISTHSPYLLTGFSATRDCCVLLTREKDSNTLHIGNACQLGKLASGQPSLAEITYFAFGIPTIEFHNELYGLALRQESDLRNEANGGSRDLGIKCFNTCLIEDYDLQLSSRQRFDNRKYNEDNSRTFEDCLSDDECLPTVIRNCIDHPESQAQAMSAYPGREGDLFEITDNLLEESIQVLLGVIEQQNQKLEK